MSENKANNTGTAVGLPPDPLVQPAPSAQPAPGITTSAREVSPAHVAALAKGVWAGRDQGAGHVQVADPGGVQAAAFSKFRENLEPHRKAALPTLGQVECLIVMVAYGMYGIETQTAIAKALARARSFGSRHVEPFVENYPPSEQMPDGYCRIVVACPDRNSRSLVWNAFDGARIGNRNRYVDLFIDS